MPSTEQPEPKTGRITILPVAGRSFGEALVMRFTAAGAEPVPPVRAGDEGWLTFRGEIHQRKREAE